MKLEGLLDHLNEFAADLDDIHTGIKSLGDDIIRLRRRIDDLPEEESDIEFEEDKENDN